MMLRHRQEPLPFILPQPLGPLPTPAPRQSVAAAAAIRLPASSVSTTSVWRDPVLPISFSPAPTSGAPGYQRLDPKNDTLYMNMERHAATRGPALPMMNTCNASGNNNHSARTTTNSFHNGMARPSLPSFLPPPPLDLVIGTLSSQDPPPHAYQLPPLLPTPTTACPVRRSSTPSPPVLRPGSYQANYLGRPHQPHQPPAPVVNFTGGSHSHTPIPPPPPTTTTSWPSGAPAPTFKGQVPRDVNDNNVPHEGMGVGGGASASSTFPGSPPRPRPAERAPALDAKKQELESPLPLVRFQCDQCPENFPTNGILKRHKKTHSAKKVRCAGCGAAYTDKSVLRVSLCLCLLKCPNRFLHVGMEG